MLCNMVKPKSSQQLTPNSLHYGDCLEVVQQWPDECVDLIYLDPPFNSKVDYNVTFQKKDSQGNSQHTSQTKAFADTWKWDETAIKRVDALTKATSHPASQVIKGLREILEGKPVLAYVSYMAERLVELHRILKPTGSLYLHCDPTASHYLKIVLDAIFEEQNFRNEIIWHYKTGGASKKQLAKKHDVILFYGKSSNTNFNPLQQKSYTTTENCKPSTNGYNGGVAEFCEDEHGAFNWVNMHDVWDISYIGSTNPERTGYPTQKPIELLSRIIEASSNPGDLVLDPFCGCGTTVEAAHGLERNWLGIDITPLAIQFIADERFLGMDTPIFGIPTDLASAKMLASNDPFNFEKWAISRIRGLAPNDKQTGDGGIDGRGYLDKAPDDFDSELVIAQVKGGKYTPDNVRAFANEIEQRNAAVGVFITMEKLTSPTAKTTASALGDISVGATSYPRLLFWSIEEYFSTNPPRPPWIPPMVNPLTGKTEATQSRIL